jgi:hypothetical protein
MRMVGRNMNIGEDDKPADVKLGEDDPHILDRRLRAGEASADVLNSVVQDLRCAARLSHLGQGATIDPDDIKAIVDLVRSAANKLRDESTLTDRPHLEQRSCAAGPGLGQSGQLSASTITGMRSEIGAGKLGHG